MSQLASLENEVLDLHRRLAEAEQRAAVAERVAAEEIAAQKAKAALGNTLAQAARAEKAEKAALTRRLAELQDELGALKSANDATAGQQKAEVKKKTSTRKTTKAATTTRKKRRRKRIRAKPVATPEVPQDEPALPKDGKDDSVPPHKTGPEEIEMAAAGAPEDKSTAAAVTPKKRTPERRGGHLTLLLAVFAAVLGWSLVIFGDSESRAPVAPVPEPLSPPAADATIEKPAQITKSDPPPAAEQASAPDIVPTPVAAPPAARNLPTRSLQNERVEQGAPDGERAEKRRAELEGQLTILRERLAETRTRLSEAETGLTEAEEQAAIARRQTALANAALASANQRIKRALERNAKEHFRVETELMAEIQNLRKALAEARRAAATPGLDAE